MKPLYLGLGKYGASQVNKTFSGKTLPYSKLISSLFIGECFKFSLSWQDILLSTTKGCEALIPFCNETYKIILQYCISLYRNNW